MEQPPGAASASAILVTATPDSPRSVPRTPELFLLFVPNPRLHWKERGRRRGGGHRNRNRSLITSEKLASPPLLTITRLCSADRSAACPDDEEEGCNPEREGGESMGTLAREGCIPRSQIVRYSLLLPPRPVSVLSSPGRLCSDFRGRQRFTRKNQVVNC